MMSALTLTVLMMLAQLIVPESVVAEDSETFRMTSPSSGELGVSRTVVVTDSKGLDGACFFLYADSFRSLKSFSGTVVSPGMKPKKLSKDALERMAFGDGLVDDGALYLYRPSGNFPLTVHYDYCVNYHGGLSSFPTFSPVLSSGQGILKASYVLNVPAGCVIQHVASGLEYGFSSEKGRDIHKWEVKDFDPVVEEDYMPPLRERLPLLYCSPRELTLGGLKGSQGSWKELGQWLWDLQTGTGELSDAEAARVREMTKDCSLASEKLAILYSYLRSRTRYVSIQLGIGGLRPMPAKVVSKMGFGDCKGLSKYMQALLAAAGVESDYLVISTGGKDLFADYPSLGQMDHVMLAVPLPEFRDTAWVECTNPAYPLGYRHGSAAGHEVLLVKDGGGETVRIPSYPDSLSLSRQKTDVKLASDGSAILSMRREVFSDFMEPYITFRALRDDEKARSLTSALKAHAEKVVVTSVSDNFNDYPVMGRGFVPHVFIDYTVSSRTFAGTGADRLFVPINPYPRIIPLQKSTRVNDLLLSEAHCYEDSVVIHVPEGYHVENVPSDVSLSSEWGLFESKTVSDRDNGTVEVSQRISHKAIRIKAADYSSFRDFARAVNRLYSGTIVLARD